MAQHHMRVRHRGQVAAAAIGDRAGHCAGALGAYRQAAGGGDAGDRAAAGADGDKIDDRQQDRIAGELAARRDLGFTLGDQADVRTGPAHIETEDIAPAGHAPDKLTR